MEYATGLSYLIYSRESNPIDLEESMCSPGGWVGNQTTELRYLRKERPLPSDLAPMYDRTPAGEARRDKERQESIRRYAAATGQVCGVISPVIDDESSVVFLPVAGYSPLGRSWAEVHPGGKFCSNRLGPGGYYLCSAGVYYPGVIDRAKASIVEVAAGQIRSDVVFHVSRQKAYTVHGFISTDDKSDLGETGAAVLLFGLDGNYWNWKPIDFRGSFPLPKLKYFTFENVLPGRYIACVQASGKGWLTKVVDVDVSTHAKLIFLELRHAKAGG